MAADVLDRFSPATREWFRTTFRDPTAAQAKGWPAIADGDHALILAPTGSGKTLTAFLHAIDRLSTAPEPDRDKRLRVLYVSPLKALAVDIDKNLRAPLRGVQLAAERLGLEWREPTVGVRTGDTEPSERQRMLRTPPDILITTPESLFLLLTSRARETLRSVDTVIIDEIHALAPSKRGSHLALSLERLEHEVTTAGSPAPQRIALSATQRPLDEIARFLGGAHEADQPARSPGDRQALADHRLEPRPVTIVDAGVRKQLELDVVVPVEDMGDLGAVVEPASELAGPTRRSIWPAMHPRLLDLVLDHGSTLIFVNARRLAERLAATLNQLHERRVRDQRLVELGIDPADADDSDEPNVIAALAEPVVELVRAHHGSLSRERRLSIEDDLKAGRLRGLVATSSLELGIDMGAVDLVIQVSSPGSVSRGLQRIGRAGHHVGQPSKGTLFPKFRGDLLETAVVVQRMEAGDIEPTRYPRNPIDVLCQQIVAMTAMEDWTVEDLARLVRRAAPFADLTDDVLDATLDLLAGRYPSDEFSELRPRITWDRAGGVLTARPGAQRLAVTNPGTIPDRGLFGVHLPDGTRVGELDEEMVHESRAGETFLLGASTWRIEEITHERVMVTPAPGEPGKMPFWHGDGPGRPVELGRAIGEFVRTTRQASLEDRDGARAQLSADAHLDDWAAENVLSYLDEQAAATGTVPDDTTVVIERFRDEIGDWRVCLLSPFGARVHAPWAMAIERQLADQGAEAEVMWSDDGIVLRLQEAVEDVPTDVFAVDPDEVEELVVGQLAGSALFTTTFREAAGRALLLPRRRPGQRTALWAQRQRAANLLSVASRHPTFPITLEATRECLQDTFDLPALRSILADVRSRRIRLVPVETAAASPFAQSLLFRWVGQYMYEYDAPLAERRAAALALDRDLLRELLGADELRELLDADVLADLELWLQYLVDERRVRHVDGLADLLRDVGDLTIAEIDARCEQPPANWVDELVAARRAIRVGIAGEERIAAAEDAARLRDALGVALPPGLPAAFTEPVEDPLADLVGRFARTHGPFHARQVAHRLGIPTERVTATLLHLERRERVVQGEFRPGGVEREWCDREVLRRLRRRTLAALRSEIEPVEAEALGRFLPAWHGIIGAEQAGPPRRGVDGLLDVVGQLQGAPIPASVLERDVLPARIGDYVPGDLDRLLAAGEIAWFGAAPIGTNDGRVVLCFRDQAGLHAPTADEPPGEPVHEAIRTALRDRGAAFWPDLLPHVGADPETALAGLWDLVWAGEVSNDTYEPVRGLLGGSRSTSHRRPRPGRLRRAGPASARGRWSLTEPLLAHPPTATALAHARAEQLLDRHGIVAAETARAEGLAGGFAGLYPVLRALEETGRIRRGYVVAGLGGAQFAAPGAIDRLRAPKTAENVILAMAATDPAQPWGATLAWPESDGRPARTAGAHVILVDGQCALYVERGGRSLVTFPTTLADTRWAVGLVDLVKQQRVRRLVIGKVDGVGVHDHAIAPVLAASGFTDDPRGLALRG